MHSVLARNYKVPVILWGEAYKPEAKGYLVLFGDNLAPVQWRKQTETVIKVFSGNEVVFDCNIGLTWHSKRNKLCFRHSAIWLHNLAFIHDKHP